MRERAEFRGDGDVVVRLRNDRRLTGEWVAYEGELVACAHQEGEEAVEVLECLVECDFERLTLIESPMDITARAFRIAIAFEACAHFLQLPAQHSGVGERAVVHEAPVL